MEEAEFIGHARTHHPPSLCVHRRHDHRQPWRVTLFAACLGTGMQTANGAGFALMEQSVKELGQAFAGASSNTEDGSSVYFNAAAMGRIDRAMLSVAGYALMPSTRFSDGGSQTSSVLGGAPLTGTDGGDAGLTSLVPNLYWLQPISKRLVFGLGLNAPFGSHAAYQSGWKGRYQTLSSELLTFNVNPSLAFRLNDDLSFGAGLNVQYLKASLTSAIDFGAACYAALGPLPCAGQGLRPQQADGRVTLDGDSVALGYNVGIHYTPRPGTALGISYRSRVEHRVDGAADFDVPAKALPMTANGYFADTAARTTTTLPDSLAFGFTQHLGEQWTLSADAIWTHWSLARELRTTLATAQPALVETLDWQDTWRWALGTSFTPSDPWTIRAGVAYDQSPVRSGMTRTPRIPDSDRVWLSIGVSYRLCDSITLHGAYAHLFFAEAPIAHAGPTGDLLVGRYQQHADILGLQLDLHY